MEKRDHRKTTVWLLASTNVLTAIAACVVIAVLLSNNLALRTELESTQLAPPPILPPTATPTFTPTPVATAPPSLNITGTVYTIVEGERRGVEGARVSYACAAPRTFQAISGPGGHYTLLVPGTYASGISDNNLSVFASGYEEESFQCVADYPLRHPTHGFICDFELAPLSTPSDTGVP